MPRQPVPWVAGADSHGDMRCPSTLAAFFEFIKYYKPQIRIGMGDHFDFRFLRAKATHSEQYQSGQMDFQCGLDFLRKFKPTHVCWGNHDDRVWELAKHPNENIAEGAVKMIEEIEDAAKTAKVRIPFSVRHRLTIGDLKIVHGFAHSDAAMKRAASLYGKVLQGDLHRDKHVTVEGLDKPRHLWCCPCLCRLDMDYMKRSMGSLNHSNGWAYGHVYPDGTTTVHIARKEGGRWLLPTEFREFKGKA